MNRVILHADCNKFYASVEALYHPELRNIPFIVGGDPLKRHGIVLTKNEHAAKFGICTGEPLWKAFQKCPQLKVVPPNFELYERFSREIYNLYHQYTEYVEAFGLDEAWMDVTESQNLFGSGVEIAYIIKDRIKKEIGITVSIGVSFNKVFAKLGSDYKKPDAVTVFTKENFREKVWPLPISSLLFVGKQVEKKLQDCFLYTIGDVARSNVDFLKALLGKQGESLYMNANGFNFTPVAKFNAERKMKTISNSTTPSQDLYSQEEVKQYFYLLAEHLSKRLEEKNLKGKTIGISLKNSNLSVLSRQINIGHYTGLAQEIAQYAYLLFQKEGGSSLPIRSLGISVSDFGEDCVQTDFFGGNRCTEKRYAVEKTVNHLKKRFGDTCVQHGVLLEGEIIKKHSTFGHCVFNHIQY